MDIQFENYRIRRFNEHNLTIEGKFGEKSKKAGQFKEDGDGRFYSSIKDACIALLNLDILDSEAKSVQELLDNIIRSEHSIKQVMSGVKL